MARGGDFEGVKYSISDLPSDVWFNFALSWYKSTALGGVQTFLDVYVNGTKTQYANSTFVSYSLVGTNCPGSGGRAVLEAGHSQAMGQMGRGPGPRGSGAPRSKE